MMQRLLDLSRTMVTQKVPAGIVTMIAIGLACLSESHVDATEKQLEGQVVASPAKSPASRPDVPLTALEWSGKVVSTRKDKMGKRADYGDKSDGLLEGAGKAIRYVKIGSETDLKKQLFTSWIKQTANANR